MTHPDTAALLARLTAATGPDRELDAEIYCTLDPTWKAKQAPTAQATGWVSKGPYTRLAPDYTGSLDAALTLVPENHMWFLGNLDPSDMRFSATISVVGNIGAEIWRSIHATAPLALTIAALRARGIVG